MASQDIDFLEFYAGRANLTKCMRKAQKKSVRFDKLYFKHSTGSGGRRHTNWYDLLTPAGFAFLWHIMIGDVDFVKPSFDLRGIHFIALEI